MSTPATLKITLVTILLIGIQSVLNAQTPDAAIYIVRHANTGPVDSGFTFSPEATPLTAAGLRRTLDLNDRLKSIDFDAVYSTNTVRTYQTARAVAQPQQVKIRPYSQLSQTQVDQWKSDLESNKNVLIVGHSNTIGTIVKKLTGNGPTEPIIKAFDNLFVVTKGDHGLQYDRQCYGELDVLGPVELVPGSLDANQLATALRNLSAVERMGSHYFLGPDEGTGILVGHKDPNDLITLTESIDLGGQKEIDIECLATSGNHLFIAGSHSWRRKNINSRGAEMSDPETRRRFEDQDESPVRAKNRERLIRLEFDTSTGKVVDGSITEMDLLDALFQNDQDVLKPFQGIPGNENGVDIEGLAIDDGQLFVGLRSPVLRFGYVPVVVAPIENPMLATVRYVQLEGRGIRAMAKVDRGFLIIAGPSSDSNVPDDFRLYLWDGEDCFPGEVRDERTTPLGHTHLLGRIGAQTNGVPEGLTILSEAGDVLNVMVIYDKIKGGGGQRLRVYQPDPVSQGQ